MEIHMFFQLRLNWEHGKFHALFFFSFEIQGTWNFACSYSYTQLEETRNIEYTVIMEYITYRYKIRCLDSTF